MSEYKKEFRYFTIFDYEKEQEYLSQMHERGWKFITVYFPGIYCFEQCKPEKVIYQLDYNQEGLAHKAEYLQMFADCGWEYLQNYTGYSYFRKAASEMDGEEEIFCDDASRLDMMKRVFTGRMIPLLVCFFLVIIPQVVLQSLNHTPLGRGFMIVFIILLGIYLGVFISFAVSFWRYYRSLSS